ncbi:hypothetical protein ANRL3_02152 [Anaerolineae bacterium]|nr:hypothetical protein ANRL3_02152 [Anaerolineae bacterium]
MIDIDEFEQVVREFFASHPNAGQSLVIALDGKTLRGVIDAYVPHITQEMYLAAMTPQGELMPNPLDKRVHRAVAHAVAKKAIEQGLARAPYVPYVEE